MRSLLPRLRTLERAAAARRDRGQLPADDRRPRLQAALDVAQMWQTFEPPTDGERQAAADRVGRLRVALDKGDYSVLDEVEHPNRGDGRKEFF